MVYCLLDLKKLIAESNIEEIKKYMNLHNLVLKNNKIVPANAEEYKEKELFWNQRQQARKILLNS